MTMLWGSCTVTERFVRHSVGGSKQQIRGDLAWLRDQGKIKVGVIKDYDRDMCREVMVQTARIVK